MLKILKYSIYDLMRSRWTYGYCAFYLLFTLSLFWLSPDLSKVLVSLMNLLLLLVPLIATMFGVMYYYNSREFAELLLAQPVRRAHIFLGQYLGVAVSLSASLILGVGLPFALYGIFGSVQMGNFLTLMLTGIALSFIFSGLAFLIALKNENRIKGFGFAILLWLVLAVVYDGIFLLSLSLFYEYPLEKFSLFFSLLNPVDLSRILMLLQLDISALMGFTGAVFQKFLGTGLGMAVALAVLAVWIFIPATFIRLVAQRKDF